MACSARETFHNQWFKHETTKEKVRVRAHYSAVDSILLMNQGLLVTGSRDRSLALWNVSSLDENDGRSGLIQKWADVHKGSIHKPCGRIYGPFLTPSPMYFINSSHNYLTMELLK